MSWVTEIEEEGEKELCGPGGFVQAASIDWAVSNIISDELLYAPPIKPTLDASGGFNAISLCSALVLLPAQLATAMSYANEFLKSGG